MHEAKMEQTDVGLEPVGDGWFVVNLADIKWDTVEGGGTWCAFEHRGSRDNLVGVGVHVLPPGESSGMYHREDEQEGFLVLSGECLLIVEGEERRLGPWDYFHCPPDTGHITIGAGEQGCAIFMLGSRRPGTGTVYPVEPAAAKYGKSVAQETTDSREAYEGRPPILPARSPWAQYRP